MNTMKTELSPAAQAVEDAAKEVSWDWCRMDQASPNIIVAAALRAAAYQVEQKLRGFSREACQEIRAIAAELEAQS